MEPPLAYEEFGKHWLLAWKVNKGASKADWIMSKIIIKKASVEEQAGASCVPIDDGKIHGIC